MNLSIQIPDKIYNQAILFAKKNNYNLDEFINSQFVSNFENYLMNHISEKAEHISRDDFKNVLSKVPDIEPQDRDKL